MMKQARTLFAALCVICTVNGANTVMDVAKKEAGKAFFDAVKSAGLMEHATKAVGVPKSMAPFTLFAPKGEKAISKDQIKLLVVPGQKLEKLEDDTFPTVDGALLAVSEGGKKLGVDEGDQTVDIVSGPHKASNGVVYVISEPLNVVEE